MTQTDHLWNDLPDELRHRLAPHMIECQIQHLKQGREKAVRAHRKCMREFDDHIKSCEESLAQLLRERSSQ